MPPYPSQKAQLRLDLKLLSKFIYELNIARHHTVTYPASHPVIGQSVQKALSYLEQLQPENGLLSLGISKDKLVAGQTILDEKNPVYKEFASHFFNHGIAVITLHQNLPEKQLKEFLGIIGQNREAVQAQGGLLGLIKAAAIDGIQVKPIDYSAFGISDQISESPPSLAAIKKKEAAIWERLVQNLLVGKGAQTQPKPQLKGKGDFAAQAVAEQLNQQVVDNELPLEGHYDRAITEFLRELDREQLSNRGSSMAITRLQGLASQLNPELRAQLLNSTFRAVAPDEKMAEKVLSQFPGTMLMEVLETLNSRQTTIPPIIFTLLDRLTQCENSQESGAPSIGNNADTKIVSSNTEGLLSPFYARDESESFIPEEYGETLRSIEAPASQQPESPPDEHYWQASFNQQPIERKVSDILFELAQTDCGEGKDKSFKKALHNLCGHFLDTGDFVSLADIYSRLSSANNDTAANDPAWFQEIRTELYSPVFISQVLETLAAWGKNAFKEFTLLLETIGPIAIGPMLDRLAIEPNRALRQFFINCLVDQGIATRDHAIPRLKDSRWYYLRNLIIILQRLGDPSSMSAITPLWDHPHEKVRYEVVKTALVFQVPQGSDHLLEEFSHPDHQRCLSAVKMARYCRDSRVKSSLLKILGDKNLSRKGLYLKFAALDSLTKQGGKDLLPHLEKRFRAYSLWHPRRQMRLRRRILRSLKNFSQDDIASLLHKLSGIKRPALARLVRQAQTELLKGAP